MEKERLCIACGAELVGPFESSLHLAGDTSELGVPEPDAGQEQVQVSASSWICPGCGLVHWYAEEQALEKLLEMIPNGLGANAQPDTSYERRSRMLRMLRRVQRM